MEAYPLHGLLENAPRACYITSAKGWLDMDVFAKYFAENCAYEADMNEHIKHVQVYNYSILLTICLPHFKLH